MFEKSYDFVSVVLTTWKMKGLCLRGSITLLVKKRPADVDNFFLDPVHLLLRKDKY